MPDRPSVHAPRRNLARTVSAWSSSVWAVATASSGNCRIVPEPAIAQAACSFFDGFGGNITRQVRHGIRSTARFGSDVYAGFMEGNIEPGGEVAAELKVGIGFGAAQAVMQVRGVEDKAEFPAPVRQARTAARRNRRRRRGRRQGACRASAGIVSSGSGRRCAHEWMIRRGDDSEKSGSNRHCECCIRGNLYTQ